MNGKRKYQRYQILKPKNITVSINYMGEEIEAAIKDISLGGLGLEIEGLLYSLIDNSVIEVQIKTDLLNLQTKARIVYSMKTNKFTRSRHYGLEFEKPSLTEVSTLIDNLC